MMNADIRAKIDQETKTKAMAILKTMGISISDYLRMAVIQLTDKNAIPFEINISHITNQVTLKAIEDDKNDIGVHKVNSIDELFKELEI